MIERCKSIETVITQQQQQQQPARARFFSYVLSLSRRRTLLQKIGRCRGRSGGFFPPLLFNRHIFSLRYLSATSLGCYSIERRSLFKTLKSAGIRLYGTILRHLRRPPVRTAHEKRNDEGGAGIYAFFFPSKGKRGRRG